jgi:hypothetical protein
MKNARKILIRNSQGKRPLARYMHRWEGNVKIDLIEIAQRV